MMLFQKAYHILYANLFYQFESGSKSLYVTYGLQHKDLFNSSMLLKFCNL